MGTLPATVPCAGGEVTVTVAIVEVSVQKTDTGDAVDAVTAWVELVQVGPDGPDAAWFLGVIVPDNFDSDAELGFVRSGASVAPPVLDPLEVATA